MGCLTPQKNTAGKPQQYLVQTRPMPGFGHSTNRWPSMHCLNTSKHRKLTASPSCLTPPFSASPHCETMPSMGTPRDQTLRTGALGQYRLTPPGSQSHEDWPHPMLRGTIPPTEGSTWSWHTWKSHRQVGQRGTQSKSSLTGAAKKVVSFTSPLPPLPKPHTRPRVCQARRASF